MDVVLIVALLLPGPDKSVAAEGCGAAVGALVPIVKITVVALFGAVRLPVSAKCSPTRLARAGWGADLTSFQAISTVDAVPCTIIAFFWPV